MACVPEEDVFRDPDNIQLELFYTAG